MADVTIPGVGPVKKPVVFIAGGGLAAVGYIWWRRKNAAASAAASTASTPAGDTSSTAYDTTGTVPTDGSGGGPGAYYAPSGFSQYGYDVYGNPLPAPTNVPGATGVYSNNADWATAAESTLENNGTDLGTAALAVSRVLGGLTVTSAQRDLFMEAVGILGQPPQGYPQPIKLTDTPGQPGPPPPTPPPSSTPGASLAAPSGLHVQSVGRSTATLAWSAVNGAIGYRVYDTRFGADVSETAALNTVIHNLSPNTTYHFYMRSLGSDGAASHAASHTITVKTKK